MNKVSLIVSGFCFVLWGYGGPILSLSQQTIFRLAHFDLFSNRLAEKLVKKKKKF